MGKILHLQSSRLDYITLEAVMVKDIFDRNTGDYYTQNWTLTIFQCFPPLSLLSAPSPTLLFILYFLFHYPTKEIFFSFQFQDSKEEIDFSTSPIDWM